MQIVVTMIINVEVLACCFHVLKTNQCSHSCRARGTIWLAYSSNKTTKLQNNNYTKPDVCPNYNYVPIYKRGVAHYIPFSGPTHYWNHKMFFLSSGFQFSDAFISQQNHFMTEAFHFYKRMLFTTSHVVGMTKKF